MIRSQMRELAASGSTTAVVGRSDDLAARNVIRGSPPGAIHDHAASLPGGHPGEHFDSGRGQLHRVCYSEGVMEER